MNVLSRLLRSRRRRTIVTIALCCCLVAGGILFAPRYRSEVSTVDGTYRWASANAPSRREIVWQPAEREPHLLDFPHPLAPMERPQFARARDVAYFSMQREGSGFDIVYSSWTNGKWSEPVRVPGINSARDDRAPVINDRGDRLVFQSNREGGFGGSDLYLSVREGEQWGQPLNLGSAINTPADERDAALTSDGLQIFFASNRGASPWDPKSDRWTKALPRGWRNQKFDLYQSQRSSREEPWQAARALVAFNSPSHHEITPSLSRDGVYLLFASDRPKPDREPNDYDIYRGLLADGGQPNSPRSPERLGVEANSPAHEFAPSLNSAGFELHFARADSEEQPALVYQSVAREAITTHRWDRSRLDALASFATRVVMAIIDRMTLIIGVLAFLLIAIWLMRRFPSREMAIPGFLMLALLLHAMLVTGSFFVFFQQSITQKLKQLFDDEVVVATQILSESSSQDSSDQPRLDQVAELREVQSLQTADVAPSTFDRVDHQPIELAMPLQVTSSTPLATEPLRELVVASLPTLAPPLERPAGIPRASQKREVAPEPIDFAAVVKVEQRAIEAIAMPATDVPQKQSETSEAAIDVMEIDAAIDASTITADNLGVKLPSDQTLTLPQAKPTIALNRRSPAVLSPASAERVPEYERVSSVVTPQANAPVRAKPEIQKASNALAVAVPLAPVEPQPASDSMVPQAAQEAIQASRVVDVTEIPAAATVASLPRAKIDQRLLVADMDVKPEMISAVDEAKALSAPLMADANLAKPDTASAVVDVTVALNQDDTAPVSLKASQAEMLPRSATPLPLVASGAANGKGLAGLLSKKPVGPRVYADASVALQSLLLRRKLDDVTKEEVVKEFGGNDQTLATIQLGLEWLVQHQANDGHWGLHNFHEQCRDYEPCSGRGNVRSDTAGTALALLPFLGDGHTHKEGRHKEVVARGISWLVKNQKPDGNLFVGGDANSFMYSHGLATIALCECYGMTADPSLRDVTQRAIDFIVAAQDARTGGWRYKPRDGADTSVVGWQVMALKSGQMAGLNVPEKSLQEARRWLQSVAGKNDRQGQFAYQGGQFNPAMSAEALLCLEYLDQDRESEPIVHGADYLVSRLPMKDRDNSYFWYYGTQAMFHLQGEHWRQWNAALHPLLIETQRTEGAIAGTWDPKDQWENSGGRLYATSLRLLMLEVYYRHLPIYQEFR